LVICTGDIELLGSAARALRWGGHVDWKGREEKRRYDFSILEEKLVGKRAVGRPRRGWKVNIKIDG
jgi:hypothetical protein